MRIHPLSVGKEFVIDTEKSAWYIFLGHPIPRKC
jgi:hypothetical protein